jgi:hypothetical protein
VGMREASSRTGTGLARTTWKLKHLAVLMSSNAI